MEKYEVSFTRSKSEFSSALFRIKYILEEKKNSYNQILCENLVIFSQDPRRTIRIFFNNHPTSVYLLKFFSRLSHNRLPRGHNMSSERLSSSSSSVSP